MHYVSFSNCLHFDLLTDCRVLRACSKQTAVLWQMIKVLLGQHDQATGGLRVVVGLHGKAPTLHHKTHGDITISTTMTKSKKLTNCQYHLHQMCVFCLLGRLPKVDLIILEGKNVRPSVRPSVRPYVRPSVRPQKVSSI